jgi:hypothetical protein
MTLELHPSFLEKAIASPSFLGDADHAAPSWEYKYS